MKWKRLTYVNPMLVFATMINLGLACTAMPGWGILNYVMAVLCIAVATESYRFFKAQENA